MPFLSEPAPPWGEPVEVAPGIRRIVARNPGPMTYHGTNTYLFDTPDGPALVDPGPGDDPGHLDAILNAVDGRLAHILLTHTHADHIGGLPALRAATGARVHVWHAPAAPCHPAASLYDGGTAAGLQAIHTPGHAPDHLCFAAPGGVVFSGDHVMSWSSTVVIPPAGTMADYMNSLDRLAGVPATLYLPGHGPPLPNPLALVAELRAHRLSREAAILSALSAAPAAVPDLTARIYNVAPELRRAAERNVIAHLLKLEGEGRAARKGDGWSSTPMPTGGT